MNKTNPMSPQQAREMARHARNMVHGGTSVDGTAKHYGISRGHYYRIVKLLEDFEENEPAAAHAEYAATVVLNDTPCRFGCVIGCAHKIDELPSAESNPVTIDPLCE